MDPLDALLERVSELEKRVVGASGLGATSRHQERPPLVEALAHASQLLNSALSGREKAFAVMQRISELNKYVDPTYEDSVMTCEAKLEVILAREQELRQDLAQLEQAQHLVSRVLDNKNAISSMEAVSGLSGQLEKLTLLTMDSVQGVEALLEQAHELYQRYTLIVKDLTRAFVVLDELVTAQEQAAAAAKASD